MGVGRLAPTPSGQIHLGNFAAFAAAWLSVRSSGGRLLYRVEDVDRARARDDVAQGQMDDLRWLGLDWDEVTAPQSSQDYGPTLKKLGDQVYFCDCNRKRVAELGHVYDGRCRDRGLREGAVRFRLPEGPVTFEDRRSGRHVVDPSRFGDPVLRRHDGLYTYNTAVVTDDIAQGVTEVVRGADLLDFTAVQIRLWEALGARPPSWLHAPLVLGPDGKKLSKSHGSTEIRMMRSTGSSPQEVWSHVAPWLGLEGVPTLALAVSRFDPARILAGPVVA